MKNSMVMFNFLFLTGRIFFRGNLLQKTRLNRICRIRWWFSFLSFVDQKCKIVSLYQGYFDTKAILNMSNSLVIFTFSVLDLILQHLSKIFIWQFDVAWLISQYFTRRGLKITLDLRLTLVLIWNSALREGFNRYFSGRFC